MLSSTRQFINELDRREIRYTLNDPTESGKDRMIIRYRGEKMPSIAVQFFFDKDCESAALRVFDIVKASDDKLAEIYFIVNKLNAEYRWVKFVFDTNDNTIQGEMDVIFRSHDVGEICAEAMSRIVDICDEAYVKIMQALWG